MTNISNVESPRRKLNRDLVQMARIIADMGPNVNQIAETSHTFRETVRYRYHRFLLDRGITVQAVPSYAKLGFKRLILIVKLAPTCEANAKSIFSALSELCYLHSFTRVLLRGEFLVHIAVPSALAERCAGVYMDLHRAGLFTELEVLAFDEMRNPPMRAEFYDFVRGTWSFDWNALKSEEMRLPLRTVPKAEKYDRTDLLVLKELDKDASRTLVKMARDLKVNVSALEFHYREHVKGRGLIKGYRLVWQGTRADLDQERSASRKDVYVELTLLLEEGTPEELGELMLLLNKTPFLWSEAYGSSYCAEVFIPHYLYLGFMEYLDGFANKVGPKLRIFVMDQSRAMRFVISYFLFDGESKTWKLDERSVTRAVGMLAPLNS
jgi:hypothetical protein